MFHVSILPSRFHFSFLSNKSKLSRPVPSRFSANVTCLAIIELGKGGYNVGLSQRSSGTRKTQCMQMEQRYVGKIQTDKDGVYHYCLLYKICRCNSL